MERVCVLIDVGNFYNLALKHLGLKEIDFDFDAFADFLIGDRVIIKEGKRAYYGTVREGSSGRDNSRAVKNQTFFYEQLKNKGWELKTSKLREKVETVIVDDRVKNYQTILDLGVTNFEYVRSREKGIDVKIATDLIVGAVDNKYDTAILVSSDTDLIPAIDWVRNRKKKRIEYIGFSRPSDNPSVVPPLKPSKSIIYVSDSQRVLVDKDIEQFVRN
jgi:uncharacterized LabA/DUF88 family protein